MKAKEVLSRQGSIVQWQSVAILFAEFLERCFEQVLVPPLVGELYVGDRVLLGASPLLPWPGAQVRHTRAGHSQS